MPQSRAHVPHTLLLQGQGGLRGVEQGRGVVQVQAARALARRRQLRQDLRPPSPCALSLPILPFTKLRRRLQPQQLHGGLHQVRPPSHGRQYQRQVAGGGDTQPKARQQVLLLLLLLLLLPPPPPPLNRRRLPR